MITISGITSITPATAQKLVATARLTAYLIILLSRVSVLLIKSVSINKIQAIVYKTILKPLTWHALIAVSGIGG